MIRTSIQSLYAVGVVLTWVVGFTTRLRGAWPIMIIDNFQDGNDGGWTHVEFPLESGAAWDVTGGAYHFTMPQPPDPGIARLVAAT
jgi:hypothetical protein